MPDMQLVAVMLIFFVAATIRGTFGFADALVAMPMLSMAVGVRTAAPLMAMVALTSAIMIMIRSWRETRVQCAWRLVIGSAVGIPIGLLFLKGVYEGLVTGVLAVVIIGFGLYRLFRPHLHALKSERTAYVFGFLGGVLGGAYNTNGPPIVVYGTLRGWDPAEFRATLQSYFIPCNALVLAMHGAGGLWNARVFQLYAWSAPGVLLALLLGGLLHRRVPAGRFDRYLYVLLIVIGAALLTHTLWPK